MESLFYLYKIVTPFPVWEFARLGAEQSQEAYLARYTQVGPYSKLPADLQKSNS